MSVFSVQPSDQDLGCERKVEAEVSTLFLTNKAPSLLTIDRWRSITNGF